MLITRSIRYLLTKEFTLGIYAKKNDNNKGIILQNILSRFQDTETSPMGPPDPKPSTYIHIHISY